MAVATGDLLVGLLVAALVERSVVWSAARLVGLLAVAMVDWSVE